MRLLFCFALLFCFVTTSAYAQNPPETQKAVPMKEPSERQIREAKAFHKHCKENRSLARRHECKCLALKYMEKRVEKGDEVRSAEIMRELRNSCLLSSQKAMKDTRDENMSEIPQEILDEAQSVHDMCISDDVMRTAHDCECIAGKFMDDRIARGPISSVSEIMAEYQGQCKNSVEIAGYQFTKCMDQSALMVPPEFKPKYFCECYASEFSKANDKAGIPTADTDSLLINIAKAACIRKLSAQ